MYYHSISTSVKITYDIQNIKRNPYFSVTDQLTGFVLKA